MKTLVTGGAGYIGSHIAVELLGTGHEVIVADNLSVGNMESLKRAQDITQRGLTFCRVDLTNPASVSELFEDTSPDIIVHSAGYKLVGESIAQPLEYYRNNILSAMNILHAMRQHHLNRLIFTSSATVYGNPEQLPITEDMPVGINIPNPYGKTKYMIEEIIKDVAGATKIDATILRCPNPIGAHPSGLLGEDTQGKPSTLPSVLLQAAAGLRAEVAILGNDFDTKDGTSERDYLHVVDMAKGHLAALEHQSPGVNVYNLGTGHATSTLELIHAFEDASGGRIPYVIKPRRPGDIGSYYCSADKARAELGWEAMASVQEACRDSWKWQINNPDGYGIPRAN